MSKSDEQAQPVKSKVQMGDLAPDFTLLNQSGIPVNLGDFLGKQPLVLYFYPRDNTAICTEEACSFLGRYEFFQPGGAEVIRVCSDSGESHQQFAKEHQHPLHTLCA